MRVTDLIIVIMLLLEVFDILDWLQNNSFQSGKLLRVLLKLLTLKCFVSFENALFMMHLQTDD